MCCCVRCCCFICICSVTVCVFWLFVFYCLCFDCGILSGVVWCAVCRSRCACVRECVYSYMCLFKITIQLTIQYPIITSHTTHSQICFKKCTETYTSSSSKHTHTKLIHTTSHTINKLTHHDKPNMNNIQHIIHDHT